MIIKKKRNSLVEICVYILLIPIIISLLSSMYLSVLKISKMSQSNISNYTKINQIIQLINVDASSSYYFETYEDELVLYTNVGMVSYKYKDDYLYRNENKYMPINTFEIVDITSDKNKQALYQLNFSIPEKKLNENEKNYLEISTKISFPIKVGE